MTEPAANETTAATKGSQAHRLRLIVGESARHDHLPAHEWLTRRALERELAGATVYRAELGYGASSRIKKSGIGALSADASMVVELVDSRERLLAFLKEIEDLQVVRKGLVTLESIEVMVYRSG